MREIPPEPDSLWEAVRVSARNDELHINLKSASPARAAGIVQEIRANEERFSLLLERTGFSGDEVRAASYDTAPSIISVKFARLEEAESEPSLDSRLVASVRGRGVFMAEAFSARIDFECASSFRSAPMIVSRRSEDWEFVEMSSRRTLSDLGMKAGGQACLCVVMKLKSGREVVRAVKRFNAG